jgi:2-oxoglutarate ferredoxin oxidoreductase subunit alpha
MTSSSSPGISLKSEGISYMVGSDLPCLICNVQRGGPGLGGIQPSQQDYYQSTKANGHGDLHLFVVAPASVQEMVTLVGTAFDVADTYRTPAMILADGALGQMMEPVDFDTALANKREVPEKTWATCGHEGKRKKNIVNSLYIDPDELEKSVLERDQRYKQIEQNEVLWEEVYTDDADIVIVSYGITSRICKTAITLARKEGIKVGLIRPITLWPFPAKELAKAAETCHSFLSVELSMGQMIEDIRLSIECKRPVALCNRAGGIIPSPEEVYAKIAELAKNGGCDK